jgi:hypothetical protein
MHCPYCQQPVTEETVQCAGCGLDMLRLDALLGIPPVLAAGLTDEEGVLNGGDIRAIKRAVGQFRDRFPQIKLALLFRQAPDVVPMRVWAWWLFNRGNFSAEIDRGYTNRDILLVVDPDRRQAAMTMGYGLEPFVGQRDLTAALAAGQPALIAGEWAGACRQILIALDQGLQSIVERMPRTYGVPMPLLIEQEAVDPTAVPW